VLHALPKSAQMSRITTKCHAHT